jgi:hypothetical protein
LAWCGSKQEEALGLRRMLPLAGQFARHSPHCNISSARRY